MLSVACTSSGHGSSSRRARTSASSFASTTSNAFSSIALADRPPEDDEPFLGEPIHVGRMLVPALLLTPGPGMVPGRALRALDQEVGHGPESMPAQSVRSPRRPPPRDPGGAPGCASGPCGPRSPARPGRVPRSSSPGLPGAGHGEAEERRGILAARRPLGVPSSASNSVSPSASACGRKWKMPPPELSITIRRSSGAWRTAARPPRSWKRARSPSTAQVRLPPPAARPAEVETRPSIPFAPRLRGEAHSLRAGTQEGLQVANGHARGREDGVTVVAAPHRARPRRPAHSSSSSAARRPSTASRDAGAPPRARPRRRASRHGRGAGSEAREALAQGPGGDSWVGAHHRGGAAGRLTPFAGGIDHDLVAGRRSHPATGAAACWSAGRRSGRSARARDPAAGHARSRRSRVTTSERSCGPRRSCEVGSARIG